MAYIPSTNLREAIAIADPSERAKKIDQLIAEALGYDADPAIIDEARNTYGSDDINIDDDASTSPNDLGVWVQAWVWIADAELEDSEEA